MYIGRTRDDCPHCRTLPGVYEQPIPARYGEHNNGLQYTLPHTVWYVRCKCGQARSSAVSVADAVEIWQVQSIARTLEQ